jgi:hypothetical protein
LSRSAGTSGRHGRANPRPKKYVTCPRVSSAASPTTSGSGRHPHLVGSARTWLPQRCFSARCRSHQPPRVGEFRESSRISWKAPRSDGWGTLRQRGGSESLARTTRSAGLQSGHPTGTVPDPVPTPDHYHKVLGGNETGTVARGLPPGLPTGWNGRRQPHHPQPHPIPLRHRSRLVGAPASEADLQLG